MKDSNDEDDEDEVDADEREYTLEEVEIVSKSLDEIRVAQRYCKLLLQVVTSVSTINSSNDTQRFQTIKSWIGAAASTAEDVESAITDLGAELYPPVDAEDAIRSDMIEKLRMSIKNFTEILTSDRVNSLIQQENLRTELLEFKGSLTN